MNKRIHLREIIQCNYALAAIKNGFDKLHHYCYIITSHSFCDIFQTLSNERFCHDMRKWTLMFYYLRPFKRASSSIQMGYLSPIYQPHYDKTNKMACVPSEDSDHLGPVWSVFAVH